MVLVPCIFCGIYFDSVEERDKCQDYHEKNRDWFYHKFLDNELIKVPEF